MATQIKSANNVILPADCVLEILKTTARLARLEGTFMLQTPVAERPVQCHSTKTPVLMYAVCAIPAATLVQGNCPPTV